MQYEFIAHIGEAPTIEISDGVVHVRDRSGEMRLERAMSIRSLTEYVERGRRALQRYADGERNVIEGG